MMLSMNYEPTATKDEAGNWLFTLDVISSYKNDLKHLFVSGSLFQFFTGPYGGRKFEVLSVHAVLEGTVIIAKEI